MPGTHAKLSASAAHRWMSCPGSVRLSEQYPSSSTLYADEGTIAHSMAEAMITENGIELAHARVKAETFYKEHPDMGSAKEMERYLEPYVEYVLECFNEELAADEAAQLMTEQRVEFTEYVPEGFGTSDVVICRDGHIHIIDLKYGKGVQVEAEHNPQLRLYALGAMDRFSMIYDLEKVTMTIYQPRLDHVSTDTLSAGFLMKWGKHIVRPAADEALSKRASFCAGEWCRFCPARYDCKARAEQTLEIEAYLKKVTLSPEDIAEILKKVDNLVKLAEDIKDSALTKALAGDEIPGFKVVEGRSNRKYSGTEEEIVRQCVGAGYDEALLFEKKLLTITNMEKLMGKKDFEKILGGYVEKPEGKPTLVPESDKRPAIIGTSAADDFADDED